jgi:hypothetical protein
MINRISLLSLTRHEHQQNVKKIIHKENENHDFFFFSISLSLASKKRNRNEFDIAINIKVYHTIVS